MSVRNRKVPYIETPITYNKDKDEHVQTLINKNLELCQGSEDVKIENIERIAKRAHERADCHETRLNRLDDPEVGKVTTLWNERNNVIKVGAVLLLAIVVNIVIGAMGNGKIDKTVLKEAVKSALEELKAP
jgi:hypothetical protein